MALTQAISFLQFSVVIFQNSEALFTTRIVLLCDKKKFLTYLFLVSSSRERRQMSVYASGAQCTLYLHKATI
jgi:hypothetical protein